MHSPYFSLMLNIALHSAHLRVCRAIYSDLFGTGSLYEPRLEGYSSLITLMAALELLSNLRPEWQPRANQPQLL